MNKQTYMEEADQSLLHMYNRFPVVFDHGEGVRLYDTEGKQYLDFAAGIGVTGLGYHNKELNDALKAQIDRLCHILQTAGRRQWKERLRPPENTHI